MAPAALLLCFGGAGCALVHEATEDAATGLGALGGAALAGPAGAAAGGVIGRRLGVTAADTLTGKEERLVDAPAGPVTIGSVEIGGTEMSDVLAIVFVVLLFLGVVAEGIVIYGQRQKLKELDELVNGKDGLWTDNKTQATQIATLQAQVAALLKP